MTAQPEDGQAALADRPPAQQAWCQGRIPLHLRVGVTGHRYLDSNDLALVTAVRENLKLIESRCRKGTAATPVSLAVVSALAEGADRIVAREGIGRGASLEVVLPLPLDDYLTDFTSDTSRSEFCTLLVDHASAITELPAAVREEAYERAGRVIVDRSDVLLALWNGEPARGRGGTAEIVSYARQQGVPVLQVTAGRLDPGPAEPQRVAQPELPQFFGLISNRAFDQLDQYNSSSPRTGRNGAGTPLLRSGLSAPVPAHVRSFVDYAQPYFDRAEQVAGSLQRLFVWLARLLYSLAAAAVILVATQIIFFSRYPQIVWAEVAALAAVIVILVFGRRARLHDRWIAARYLAERIRSGVFVAAVGAGDDPRSARGGTQPADSGPPDPDREQAARAVLLRRWARDRWIAARNGGQRVRDVELRSDAGALQLTPSGMELPDFSWPDPNQEWVERAFSEIYWRARKSPPPETEFPELRALLTEAWIDHQACYHSGVYRRLTKRQRWLHSLAIALFGVAVVVAVLHSTSVLQSAFRYDVWGYCSVVIPAIGAAIAGYSAQREYTRLAERSGAMVRRLNEARYQVKCSQGLSSLQDAARKAELLMRSETAEWYQVIRLKDLEIPG